MSNVDATLNVVADDEPACSPTQLLATLGVSHEEFRVHQEQLRRSFRSASDHKSLPFPLNLPPSYPTLSSSTLSSSSATLSMRPRPASITPNISAPGVSLDAFMHSRQAHQARHDIDESASDSDVSLINVITRVSSSKTRATVLGSKLPSSSPPSSSPIHTPRESSPMHAYPSSPTTRPKDASQSSYTLPPGPYSRQKPSWSLAALIGQSLTASHSGALPLNDIYTYISTVYPHYNRRDQPWMSSVRHSLSVNEAFERVPDQDGVTTRRGRSKGMTRLKGGLWRIKPGHEACFEGGNFVRKGAKGAGPGKSMGGRKRKREADEEHNDKKRKLDGASLAPSQPGSSRHSSSPAVPGEGSPTACTTPVLVTSDGTVVSESLYCLPSSSPAKSGIASPDSPDLPLALTLARSSSSTQASSLEPGFELNTKRRVSLFSSLRIAPFL